MRKSAKRSKGDTKMARRAVDVEKAVLLYKKHKNMCIVAEKIDSSPSAVRYQIKKSGLKIHRAANQRRWKGERLEQVREILKKFGPMSPADIAKEMTNAGHPISKETLKNHISIWRKQSGHKLIRIADFDVVDGHRISYYGLGPKPDFTGADDLTFSARMKVAETIKWVETLSKLKPVAQPFDGLMKHAL